MTHIVKKNHGRALEKGARIENAAVSENLEAALLTIPDVFFITRERDSS